MIATMCVITWALVPAQAVGTDWLLTPRLNRALELVYRGSYTEEAHGKGVQCTRGYRLESKVFVIDASASGAELAVLTSLKLQAPRLGEPAKEPDSGSVRLELARLSARGGLTSQTGASLLAPLTGPPTIECGALVEVPNGRVKLDAAWEVNEEGRPPLTWMVVGVETVNGTSCVKLAGLQQSDDWQQPRADHMGWRRQDFVWMSPRLGIAQRVERIIEQREPGRREPSQRSVTRYDLESSLVYPGQLYDDRHREIQQYWSLAESAAPLLGEPGKHGAAPCDALITRINHYVDNHPPTPYRETLVQLKRRLETARKGQATVVADRHELFTVATPGKPAPDFVMPGLISKESVRLRRLLGRPILLVFYNPSSHLAEEVMSFAQRIYETQREVIVLGLAYSDDSDAVIKQYRELKLSFPLLPGKGLRLTYAVEATPKFIVIDAEGVVRSTYVGWGREMPPTITEELKRCGKVEQRR